MRWRPVTRLGRLRGYQGGVLGACLQIRQLGGYAAAVWPGCDPGYRRDWRCGEILRSGIQSGNILRLSPECSEKCGRGRVESGFGSYGLLGRVAFATFEQGKWSRWAFSGAGGRVRCPRTWARIRKVAWSPRLLRQLRFRRPHLPPCPFKCRHLPPCRFTCSRRARLLIRIVLNY